MGTEHSNNSNGDELYFFPFKKKLFELIQTGSNIDFSDLT